MGCGGGADVAPHDGLCMEGREGRTAHVCRREQRITQKSRCELPSTTTWAPQPPRPGPPARPPRPQPSHNKLLALFGNLPLVVPVAKKFREYHHDHHIFLVSWLVGVEGSGGWSVLVADWFWEGGPCGLLVWA